jgi:hypothetical protein
MKKIFPDTGNTVFFLRTKYLLFLPVLAFFFSFSSYGQEISSASRPPIDINIIIDGSQAFSNVKDEVTSWINSRLDNIMTDGDRVTIWSAGQTASVIYSGSIDGTERGNVKTTISGLPADGNRADFSGALADAAGRQSGSSYSYTLLISASTEGLSSVISGPQANLLRFSKMEEYSTWRALVVGLNLDTRVRRAASAFLGS